MENSHNIIIERASKEFDYFHNLIKTIEELNELSTEIAKRLLAVDDTKVDEIENNINKEIQDVKICIGIIEHYFSPEIRNKEYSKRVDRLEGRLNKQKEIKL